MSTPSATPALIHLKVTDSRGREIREEGGSFPPLTFVQAMLDAGAGVADIDGFADTLAAGATVSLEGGACPLFEYRFSA